MSTSDHQVALPLAAKCVRSLLERHGLPKYRQSVWLANAMGLSYSQAHRRLNGASPWSLEDLAQLAGLFGETLAQLVATPETHPAVNAVLPTGGEALSCRVWLGEAVAVPTAGGVYAVKSRSGWVVATASEGLEGEVFKITRLEAYPALHKRRVIAVLDDDRNVTDSIVNSFAMLGYNARPFYRVADLLASAATSTFDSFVLDWVVDDGTVLDLVRTVRATDTSCPIIILTAQVATGVIDETDIADAMKRYDLLYCEKPVRTSILAAMLLRAFAS